MSESSSSQFGKFMLQKLRLFFQKRKKKYPVLCVVHPVKCSITTTANRVIGLCGPLCERKRGRGNGKTLQRSVKVTDCLHFKKQ